MAKNKLSIYLVKEEIDKDKIPVGAVIVCKNPHSMENKAKSYGILGLKFIGYEEMDSHILNGDKIAVDELGNFFEHCYGAKLDSFTMTID